MALFWWMYLIITAGLVGACLYGSWTFLRAWEAKFDAAKLEAHGRRLDFRKAREQQYTVLGLGLPLGLILIGLLVWHLFASFTISTYTVIAIGWFVTAPLRQLWALFIGWKLRRRLAADRGLHHRRARRAHPQPARTPPALLAVRPPVADSHRGRRGGHGRLTSLPPTGLHGPVFHAFI